MSPLIETRPATLGETESFKWSVTAKDDGPRFRGSEELHELARNIISILNDPNSEGIACLVFDKDSDVFSDRRSIKNAVEVLSQRKIQTRRIDEFDDNGSRLGSKVYLRYKPSDDSSKR